MKKRLIFILFFVIFLVSCNKNELLNISFNNEPKKEYIEGTSTEEALKDITIKIQRKKNTQIVNAKDMKIEGFDLSTIGEHVMIVKYEGKELSWKYNVVVKPWDGSIDTSWYDDTAKSYLIKNANEFAGIAKLVNEGRDFKDKMITLTKDIDLGDNQWIPIGTDGKGISTAEHNYFSGIFDGNNHLISNIKIIAKHNGSGEHIESSESYYNCGLFGQVKNGTIKDLKIKNVTIQNGMMNNYTRAMQGTGSLVGWLNGGSIIKDIEISGDINIRAEYKVGGAIGNISKENVTIENISVIGNQNSMVYGSDKEFKDTNNFGGLIGFSDCANLMITKCKTNILVSGYTSGGIIGCSSNAKCTIDNCTVLGVTQDPEGSICGGIMGGRFASVTIKDCNVLGSILIGELEENKYADVLVSKYGTITEVNASNNYYDKTKMSDKIFNSLKAIPKEIKNTNNLNRFEMNTYEKKITY